MPFALYTYRRVGDLESALRALPPAEERMFLVAGSGDRRLLDRALRGKIAGAVRRWDELYRYFSQALRVEAPRVQLDPPDHWLLVHDLVRRYAEKGGILPAGARRSGFLSLLGSQIRELIREDVGPDALEGLYAPDDEMGAAFRSLYSGYLSALDECKLSDSAGVTTQTRLLLDLPGADAVCWQLELVLVGFASLTHSQLALTRALVRHGASVKLFAPVSGMSDAYGAAQQFGVDGEELSPRSPWHVRELEGGDPRQEFETAARSLALWESGCGPLGDLGPWPGWEAVAASVPRERLPEAYEVFSRYGLPYSPAFRVKVSETPLWQLASACLDAASGGWQTEPTLRLLSLPWLCGGKLDVKGLRSSHLRGAGAWSGALKDTSAAEDFAACLAFARAVNAGGTAGTLLKALYDFLCARALKAARLVVEYPELDAVISLFSSALRELDRKLLFVREVVRDLGPFGSQELPRSDARAWLAAWADGTTVEQPGGGQGCMTVFTGTPPTLFHAPYWFLFGVTADQWPGGLRESPLLSEAQKEQLHGAAALGLDRSHLPLLGEQRQQREVLFRRLIACGDRCTILCRSLTDQQDRPLDESPLIKAAEADGWCVCGPKVTRGLDSLLVSCDEPLLAPVEARRPNLRVENGLPPERSCPGSFDVTLDTVRLSAVDDYATCPYMFALRHVLKYPEPPRVGEYDVLRGGTAVHRLWERVWRAYAKGGYQSSVAALTDRFFDETIEEEYPSLLSSPSLRRSLVELRYRVNRCAVRQDELEVVLLELRVGTECEVDLPPLKIGNITFTGRCDRLDRFRDGSFMLWDYKAGSSNGYRGAYQLACYALALGAENCAGWAYICQRDGRICGTWNAGLGLNSEHLIIAKAGRQVLSPESCMEDARELLTRIDQAVKDGDYPPTFENAKSFCSYCAYASLCRRGELSADVEKEEENEE